MDVGRSGRHAVHGLVRHALPWIAVVVDGTHRYSQTLVSQEINHLINRRMSTIRNLYAGLSTDWHFMRWLRLALGVFVSVQAVQMHDPLAGMIAFFFFFQAVTNTGCCGAQGCALPAQKKEVITTEEVKVRELEY